MASAAVTPPLLEIHLFGPLQVKWQGESLHFPSDRVRALFAYLVLEFQRAHHRETLAGVLWSEMDEQKARTNLRISLSRLRKSLAPYVDEETDEPGFLEITRRIVQIHPEPAYCFVDVLRFDELVTEWERAPETPEAPQLLEKAVTLYKNDLLTGLFISDSPPFEEWLTLQREQRHQQMMDALQSLTSQYMDEERWDDAQKFAKQQLALEPWREEAHRQLIEILAGKGDRSGALQQYQICTEVMEEEFGVEPSLETNLLIQTLRYSEEVPLPSSLLQPPSTPEIELPQEPPAVAPPHNIPASRLPFFGREKELDKLQARLLDATTRMVTLTGMGGVGKSTLAKEAARRTLHHFPDGVWFVPLADLPSKLHDPTNQVLLTIGRTLGLEFGQQTSPFERLIAYLRETQLLLILDNFEHINEAADILVPLLEQAPHVTLLITSRERLYFQSEFVLPLHGLPVPEPNAPNADEYSSVRLFLERFLRHRGGSLDYTLEEIVEICKRLNGVPLALELAASWGAQYFPSEIASALDENSTLLSTRMRDLPARHRSIAAVFEGSWELLSPALQQTLMNLSVFQGDFSADAAKQIIDAPRNNLDTLVSCSLVQQPTSGRYRLHSLLHEYAQEKAHYNLDEARRAKVYSRYVRYYLGPLSQNKALMTSEDSLATLDALQKEYTEILAAWRWAVFLGEWSLLEESVSGLALLFRMLSLFHEGEATFSHSEEQLQASLQGSPDQWPTDQHKALASIQAQRVYFLQSLSYMDEAIKKADQTLETLRPSWVELELECRLYQADAMQRQGDFDTAKSTYEHVATLANQHNYPRLEGLALSNIGSILDEQGYFSKAESCLEQALKLLRSQENLLDLMSLYNNLGSVAWREGKHEQARHHYETALELGEKLRFRAGKKMILANLGILLEEQGSYQQAMDYYQQSLEIGEQLGDRRGNSITLGNMGTLCLRYGDNRNAELHFAQSLKIAREIGDRQGETWVLANQAWLYLRQSKPQQALQAGQTSRTIAEAINDRNNQANANYYMGQAFSQLGSHTEATKHLTLAKELRSEMQQQGHVLEVMASLAQISSQQGSRELALVTAREIAEEITPEHFASMDDPVATCRIVYNILEDLAPSLAEEVLTLARNFLAHALQLIQDPAMRESLLYAIPSHQWLNSVMSVET